MMCLRDSAAKGHQGKCHKEDHKLNTPLTHTSYRRILMHEEPEIRRGQLAPLQKDLGKMKCRLMRALPLIRRVGGKGGRPAAMRLALVVAVGEAETAAAMVKRAAKIKESFMVEAGIEQGWGSRHRSE